MTTLEELAKLYEMKRGQLEQLSEEVYKLKQQYNETREFDKKYVWCSLHNMKHRIGTIAAEHGQKIPKQCLTKYDHIYVSDNNRQPRKQYLKEPWTSGAYIWWYPEKCMVCGHEVEVEGNIVEFDSQPKPNKTSE